MQVMGEYLTPRDWCRLPTNLFTQKVKGLLLMKSFAALAQLEITTVQARSFWEVTLPESGITPPLIPTGVQVPYKFVESHQYGPRRYTFLEWSCCDVTTTRWYWQHLFTDIPPWMAERCWHWGQQLVDRLPGKRATCSQCHWRLPMTEMYDQHTCSFCHTPQPAGRLSDKLPHLKLGEHRLEKLLQQLTLGASG